MKPYRKKEKVVIEIHVHIDIKRVKFKILKIPFAFVDLCKN